MRSSSRWFPVVGFASLWAAGAVIVPESTFHLGPLIVAAVPAIGTRHRRLFWAPVGTCLAVGVSLVLATLGHLGGPSLLPVGGALFESTVAAVLGGLAGFIFAGRLFPPKERSYGGSLQK